MSGFPQEYQNLCRNLSFESKIMIITTTQKYISGSYWLIKGCHSPLSFNYFAKNFSKTFSERFQIGGSKGIKPLNIAVFGLPREQQMRPLKLIPP